MRLAILWFVQVLSVQEMREAVRAALTEDIGSGDATTLAVVPEQTQARALMVAREPLVVAGVQFAEIAFRELSTELRIERATQDGDHVAANGAILRISGPAQPMLSAERVALNFVQRLSGVATLTAKFVEAVIGTSAQILDTRKTTPGLRLAEKYAVSCAGGPKHRFGLFEIGLIKGNHLTHCRKARPSPDHS